MKKNLFSKESYTFSFDVLNKKVVMRSIKKDFSKDIVKDIQGMVDRGEIRPLYCYGNAYVVAKYLISKGYTNIKVVDGIYECNKIKNGVDTHRFIQYITPEGITRYYDPTVEFLPHMFGTWAWTYTAIRAFDLETIDKYDVIRNNDVSSFWKNNRKRQPEGFDVPVGHGTTLDNTKYRGYINILPYIDDSGEYVSIYKVAEVYNFDKIVNLSYRR